MGKVKNRNEMYMYYILESAKLDYTKNLPNQTILNYLRTRLCHPNLPSKFKASVFVQPYKLYYASHNNDTRYFV